MSIKIPGGHIVVPESVDAIKGVSKGIESVVNVREIRLEKGQAKAVTSQELLNLDFYGGIQLPHEVKPELGSDYHEILAKMVSRDFDVALQERLDWAVKNKKIDGGKDYGQRYDDRKLRFDGYEWAAGGELILKFGPSHFKEHQATNVKAHDDPAYHSRLSALGVGHFGDEFAYLASNLALNAVLRTADDKYIFGLRSKGAELYPNRWHNIGGFMDPSLIFKCFNEEGGSPKILESFEEGMLAELYEEAGVMFYDAANKPTTVAEKKKLLGELKKQQDIPTKEKAAIARQVVNHFRLIGVSYGVSSFDINYEARTSLDSKDILELGFYMGADASEHSGLIAVTQRDLIDVLSGTKLFDGTSPTGVRDRSNDGKGKYTEMASSIVPIGRGGMLIHLGLQDKDALKYILKQPPYQFSV